jgi:UDP-N-acetylmuramate dehydrogenase
MVRALRYNDALEQVEGIRVVENAPLAAVTRFGLGGPARFLVDGLTEAGFLAALAAARGSGLPVAVIGGGSNLVVADSGFPGIVLRFCGNALAVEGNLLRAEAGAELQSLVDLSIEAGLDGLHTLTRVPGWVGGAIYGNAGAYGHSCHEFVTRVRYFDGAGVREMDNAGCEFAYRESIFKRRKDWIILEAEFRLPYGDQQVLARRAAEIRSVRDEKFPPTMRCAGSIFKNCLVRDLPAGALAEVPEAVIREGKIPSAWFLEQVGAKGMRLGDIQVAAYHANLIYNDGAGSATDVKNLAAELKQRVAARFGIEIEEEVQYLGFDD